jgi:hypothetical protein
MVNVRRIFPTLCLVLLIISWSACKKQAEKKINLDSLSVVLLASRDSMDVIWKEMVLIDTNKLRRTAILLEEVAQIKGANLVLIDSLKRQHNALHQQKLFQDSLSYQVIEEYDQQTIHLMEGLARLTSGIPGFDQYQKPSSLWTEIQQADQAGIEQRIRYEKFLDQYNQILSTYGQELKEKKRTLKNLLPKQGFKVSQ